MNESRASWTTTLVVGVISLLPRLYAALAFSREPVWDGHYYDYGARRIAQGLGYSDDLMMGAATLWRPWCHYPVGYSGFLAFLYSIFGNGQFIAPVANALLGAWAVMITHRIGIHWLSPRRARSACDDASDDGDMDSGRVGKTTFGSGGNGSRVGVRNLGPAADDLAGSVAWGGDGRLVPWHSKNFVDVLSHDGRGVMCGFSLDDTKLSCDGRLCVGVDQWGLELGHRSISSGDGSIRDAQSFGWLCCGHRAGATRSVLGIVGDELDQAGFLALVAIGSPQVGALFRSCFVCRGISWPGRPAALVRTGAATMARLAYDGPSTAVECGSVWVRGFSGSRCERFCRGNRATNDRCRFRGVCLECGSTFVLAPCVMYRSDWIDSEKKCAGIGNRGDGPHHLVSSVCCDPRDFFWRGPISRSAHSDDVFVGGGLFPTFTKRR